MEKARIEKVISQLPATLEKNTVYYVRVGNGFEIYVTNNAGLVMAYPSNYINSNQLSNFVTTNTYQDINVLKNFTQGLSVVGSGVNTNYTKIVLGNNYASTRWALSAGNNFATEENFYIGKWNNGIFESGISIDNNFTLHTANHGNSSQWQAGYNFSLIGATVAQLNAKVNALEKVTGLGFTNANSSNPPYVFHADDGFIFIVSENATQDISGQKYFKKPIINNSPDSVRGDTGNVGTNYKALLTNGGNYGTAFWVEGDGNGFIQQQRFDGNPIAYALRLQPLGGLLVYGTNEVATVNQFQNYYTKNETLSLFVGINGVQTIYDTKTFNASPIIPNGTLGTHAVNLDQLNTRINGDYLANHFINDANSADDTKGVVFHYCSGINLPPGVGEAVLMTTSYYPNYFSNQFATDFYTGEHYLRTQQFGVWGDYFKFWSTKHFSATDIANWNTAFNYGNHAQAGYLTSSSLTGYVTQSSLNTQLSGYSPVIHTHTANDIVDLQDVLDSVFADFIRNFVNYADVRLYGAKGDGVDLGIGNYEGDHDAINLALQRNKRVVIQSGVYIVKKPIILNDGNELYIANDAVLKLGDAANCTLLKNSHVDLYKDAVGNVTYPNNFKRHKGIKVHGGGVIDCNGWMQNRANDVNLANDNPAVINTPTFPDGNGMGSYYFGCAIKFADIDDFEFSNLTIKNPRTYGILAGGLRKFSFNNLIAERTYSVVNQDFMHFHGDCYDGEVHDLYGVSGDDFVAVTTRESNDLTLRKGDFKRVKFYNFFHFGIAPAATPTNQMPMSELGIESGIPSYRCLRLSYSGDDVIDDIIIDNINATESKIYCPFVFSKLPFSTGTTEAEKYSGTGYIGKVSISRLSQTNSKGIIGTSDYVKIKHIILSDIDDIRIVENDGRSIIAENEDFIGTNPNFTHSKIENLTIRDFNSYIGAVNILKAYIDWRGEISRLVIDNFASYSADGTSGYLDKFIRANVKEMTLTNSKLDRYNKLFELTNSDGVLKESNCRYSPAKQLETQVFLNASSNTLILNDNSTTPYTGQMVLTSTGVKTYTPSTSWVSIV